VAAERGALHRNLILTEPEELNLEEEGVSAYALQRGTWWTVLNRFNANPILQEHIESLLARKQSFLDLDQDERLEQPVHVDPQHTLRAYMDDQYAVGPRAPSPLRRRG
jgi:hypothetical protein